MDFKLGSKYESHFLRIDVKMFAICVLKVSINLSEFKYALNSYTVIINLASSDGTPYKRCPVVLIDKLDPAG